MKRYLLLLLLLLTLPAYAQPYVFGGFGPANETNVDGESDTTLPAWAGLGYRKGSWAGELEYANLATIKYDLQNSDVQKILFERTWEGRGLGAFAVYHIGKGFLARSGVYRLKSYTSVMDVNGGNFSRSQILLAPSVGFGWEGELEKRITGRLTFEYVRGKNDFRAATIGGFTLLYGF